MTFVAAHNYVAKMGRKTVHLRQIPRFCRFTMVPLHALSHTFERAASPLIQTK